MGDQTHVKCNKHRLPFIAYTTRTNKRECGKTEFLRCYKFSCRYFMWKRCFENIYKDITTFFQSSDHGNNYSSNNNEASDTDYDYNSDAELLEPYLLDDNDIKMNERGNQTNNVENNILYNDNIYIF